jgi:hypothetical protein
MIRGAEEKIPLLTQRMGALIQNLETILSAIEQGYPDQIGIFASLKAKVRTLSDMVLRVSKVEQQLKIAKVLAMLPLVGNTGNGEQEGAVSLQSIPVWSLFSRQSRSVDAFFPLTGQHAGLECMACHANGPYAGTPNTCEGCHSDVKPVNHFSGVCSACHNTIDWRQVTFDHQAAVATDCQDCHSQDKPANHFSGQCLACHNTTDWRQATFNHQAAGATDCQDCHSQDKPANHFTGQCSQCHNTSNWGDAHFDHSSVGTDCLSCHQDDRPENHFQGQCSACHNTNNWKDANFDHSSVGVTASLAIKVTVRNHFQDNARSATIPIIGAMLTDQQPDEPRRR